MKSKVPILKTQLKIHDVHGKMNWSDVFKYYFPKMKKKEAVHLLWEETCYPFSHEIALEQIYKLYQESLKAKDLTV